MICGGALAHVTEPSTVIWHDISFWILACLILVVSSRVSIPVSLIKGVRGTISVTDTLLFIGLLLYGSDAAILLAASDGALGTRHVSRRPLTFIVNGAVMAISMFLTSSALHLTVGNPTEVLRAGFSAQLLMATVIMAMVQYAANSGLVAFAQSCKINCSFRETWTKYYLWSSVTFFGAAAAAVIIARLISMFGFYAVIAATPVIVSMFFTYRMYVNNIEASVKQMEQTEAHLRQLKQSEERFRSAFDFAAIGMALVAPDGKWLEVNRSLCDLLGYTETEMLATNFQSLTHADDLTSAQTGINDLLTGEAVNFQMEKRYTHKDRRVVWVLWSVSKTVDAKEDSFHLIFQIQDITDRKRAEGQLQHDAFHDALTGLPNRALFMENLKLTMKRATRNQSFQYAVLFLDLDRFKVINDSLGHMAGDKLLILIARRLETCLRPGDTVARLGGDEFTILLEDITSIDEAIQVAERIKQELALPFHLASGGDGVTARLHEVFTTTSVGIAHSGHGYKRPDDLLRDADTAMYRAKSMGKTRHEVFDPAMHADAAHLLQLETDLRRALERDEFCVYYQPIVSLETGKLASLEALVRWQHPTKGFVSPDDFIPLAEETGLIMPLGEWVLRAACEQLRRWQAELALPAEVTMSVNLSGKQFAQNDLIDSIKRVLDGAQLAPNSLKLEITESIVMQNIETAADSMRELRALGVHLSIDDFGTGYSSLSYLHRFPISTLKIDRSFVGAMSGNNENTEIVRTIIMLAQNLGLDVVAEGVETHDQLTQLRALNCEYAQGYLFAKPLTAADAAAIISRPVNLIETSLSVATPNQANTLAA